MKSFTCAGGCADLCAGAGHHALSAVANYLNAQSQTVAIDQYEEAARANTTLRGLLEQAQAFNEGV
ncbi:MAG: hypothetical protein ACLS6G_08485 [Christensenellales bacterium]